MLRRQRRGCGRHSQFALNPCRRGSSGQY
jgi:hypothetical protein